MHSHDLGANTLPRTERLRSITELAAEWGVHRNTIHALVRRGELRAVRVGRRLRFRPEDVERYLERDREPVR